MCLLHSLGSYQKPIFDHLCFLFLNLAIKEAH